MIIQTLKRTVVADKSVAHFCQIVCSIIVLLTAICGVATSIEAADLASAETNDLQGRWMVVSLESDGQKAPVEALKGGSWTFKGSGVSFDDPHAPGKASVKIYPSKSPKAIDLVALDGHQKGKTSEGIYKLEDGLLTICLRDAATREKGRPAEFVTTANSGLGLIVLKRADR